MWLLASILVARLSSVSLKVSASLNDVGSLAVGAFDLVNRSLSVPVFNVGQ